LVYFLKADLDIIIHDPEPITTWLNTEPNFTDRHQCIISRSDCWTGESL